MKPKRRWPLVALVAALLIFVWLWNRYGEGHVIATANDEDVACRIAVYSYPSRSSFERLLQLAGWEIGKPIYTCEVLWRNVPITACSFTFGGSYQVKKASIEIHRFTIHREGDPYDEYVLFHFDGHVRRCDLSRFEKARWGWNRAPTEP